MKLPESLKTSVIIIFSFVAVFILFNLDKGGQLSVYLVEYFPNKDVVFTLTLVSFFVYGIIKAVGIRKTQTPDVKEKTRFWYVLFLTICSLNISALVLNAFFS